MYKSSTLLRKKAVSPVSSREEGLVHVLVLQRLAVLLGEQEVVLWRQVGSPRVQKGLQLGVQGGRDGQCRSDAVRSAGLVIVRAVADHPSYDRKQGKVKGG